MKITNLQHRALMIAGRNRGIVDTLQVRGSTGTSLVKRGLMYRHSTDGDGYEGTNVTYELTDSGWAYVSQFIPDWHAQS